MGTQPPPWIIPANRHLSICAILNSIFQLKDLSRLGFLRCKRSSGKIRNVNQIKSARRQQLQHDPESGSDCYRISIILSRFPDGSLRSNAKRKSHLQVGPGFQSESKANCQFRVKSGHVSLFVCACVGLMERVFLVIADLAFALN